MNEENVLKAVTVIERAKADDHPLDMETWQSDDFPIKSVTWEELHRCGTPACFGGLIAVSPEFQDDGGSAGYVGEPIIKELEAHEAVAYWIDIKDIDAAALCYVNTCPGSDLYLDKRPDDVTLDDVLKILYRLRDTGSIWP